jgi:hypothetical protein
MAAVRWGFVFQMLVFTMALSGCTLPWLGSSQSVAATIIVETVSALQTVVVGTMTSQAEQAQVPVSTPTAQPSITSTFAPTRVPEKPVVNTTALCWTGPGTAYPVVSGVKAGTAVTVLGVGSKEGWFVIENPIYRDRCWIEAIYLRLDPNFTTVGLKVYNPPPTPGPKATQAPTPTP